MFPDFRNHSGPISMHSWRSPAGIRIIPNSPRGGVNHYGSVISLDVITPSREKSH